MGSAADGPEVVVKFCFRYGEAAHRLLADREPPLAPKLHRCVPLLGGVTMVVMDIAPGFDDFETTQVNFKLPSATLADIRTAVAELHSAGLVHGDVRRPNVVAAQRGDGEIGGMLIDFDWAGEEGRVRYPAALNGGLGWASGVHAGSLIKCAHDDGMVEKLENQREMPF